MEFVPVANHKLAGTWEKPISVLFQVIGSMPVINPGGLQVTHIHAHSNTLNSLPGSAAQEFI
jgi:hypothetical protein